jgi:putative transposase
VAQQVFKTLEHNYRSWFGLRKRGHANAKPPAFRKPGKPSAFHFTSYGFKILDDANIQLSSKNAFGENIIIKVRGRPDIRISSIRTAKILRIVFAKRKVAAHLVYETQPESKATNGRVLSIDLGIKNSATTYDTFGTARIYKGSQILAIAYYFDKRIAKLQSQLPKLPDGKTQRFSKLLRRLHRKKAAQISHILHGYAKNIRDYCIAHDIRAVAVGDLKNIRENMTTGKARNLGWKANAKLHTWPYNRTKTLLAYKLEETGIRLETVSEKYTSRTCPACGDRARRNRFSRGNYRCSKCGYQNQSDIIGAMNLLTRYQQGNLLPSCNSRVNSGLVVKWDRPRLTCTEAPAFRQG